MHVLRVSKGQCYGGNIKDLSLRCYLDLADSAALCAEMLHFTKMNFVPAHNFRHYSISICIYNKIITIQNIFIQLIICYMRWNLQ